MIWPGDIVSAIVISVVLLFIILGTEFWKRSSNPKPEFTRKFVHITGGLVSLFLPFLIKSPYVVLVIAILFSGYILLGSKVGFLKGLHDVGRETSGAEYYPFAVFFVFLLSNGEYWLYLSSVLVLAVADSFAGLIGSKYGVIHYQIENENKSLEGSLGFFFIAFLSIHLPLLLLTDIPREICVLSALVVSVLVTALEAISLKGSDNLIVPIVVCVVLGKIVDKPLSEIIYQSINLLSIIIILGFCMWRAKPFNVGGIIAVLLFLCAAWTLGSPYWAVPVLFGTASYILTWFFTPAQEKKFPVIKVKLALKVLLIPFSILVFANSLSELNFFYAPFIAACTVVLAFSFWNRIMRIFEFRGFKRKASTIIVGVLSWFIVGVISWWIQSGNTNSLLYIGGVCLIIVILNDTLVGPRYSFDVNELWRTSRFIMPFLAAASLIGFQYYGFITPWNPR